MSNTHTIVTEKVCIDSVPLRLAPATWNDLDALAALMVQLYNSELPGGMGGPPAGQRALMRYFIERSGAEGIRGRYMAFDSMGTIVGTAALRFHGDPDVGSIPTGTIRVALRELGLVRSAMLFGTMLRAMFAPETRTEPGTAYIHSVVVDAERRGQGVGHALMAAVEQVARARNARTCILRVVTTNQGARRLYSELGYQFVERTPRWMDGLTFPTELMKKSLQGAA